MAVTRAYSPEIIFYLHLSAERPKKPDAILLKELEK
jgi:hypothetical protein